MKVIVGICSALFYTILVHAATTTTTTTIPVLARAQLWALVGARNTPVAAIQKYSRVIVNYSREDDYFTERKPTHKIVR